MPHLLIYRFGITLDWQHATVLRGICILVTSRIVRLIPDGTEPVD